MVAPRRVLRQGAAACYAPGLQGTIVSEKYAVSSAGNGLDPFAQRHFLRNASMLALENAGFIMAITFVSLGLKKPVRLR
jgi:hypothetical protein